MVMIKLNISQAKTHLSEYIARVERGETVVVCRRNQPVAELRPLRQRRARKRPIGLAAGEFKIPKSFFEPLPADLEAAFAGESS